MQKLLRSLALFAALSSVGPMLVAETMGTNPRPRLEASGLLMLQLSFEIYMG